MVISLCVANDHGAGPIGARGRLADVNAPSLISNASVIARPSVIITATAARTQALTNADMPSYMPQRRIWNA
jgi:hypothetical protein